MASNVMGESGNIGWRFLLRLSDEHRNRPRGFSYLLSFNMHVESCHIRQGGIWSSVAAEAFCGDIPLELISGANGFYVPWSRFFSSSCQ